MMKYEFYLMHLSSKVIYGLRILYHVAEAASGGSLARGPKVAAAIGLNDSSLEQISATLRKAGLIRTVRGRNGGYTLGTSPENITLLAIIEAVEGPISMVGDLKERHRTDPIWGSLADAVSRQASEITLAEVLEKYQQPVDSFVI